MMSASTETVMAAGEFRMKFRENSDSRYSLISEDGRFKMREESRDAGENKIFYEFAWERDPVLRTMIEADKVLSYGSGPRTVDVSIDMAELRRSMTQDKYLDRLKRTMSDDDLHELGDIIAQALTEFYTPRIVTMPPTAGLIVNVALRFGGGEVRNYRNGELLGGK
jgi:hypothetical protein